MTSPFPYIHKARLSLPQLGRRVGWGFRRCGFLLLLFILSSCSGIFLDEQKPNTAKNNFDLLWKIIDERYCFFEEKKVDWNRMYDKYWHELVSFGNDLEPVSPYLFDRMAFMLEELRDGHVSIYDGCTTRSFSGWYVPYPDNFIHGRIESYRNNDSRTRYLDNETTLSVLPESIGYIRCPSFSDKFNRNDLDRAMARLEGCKGVIIDVRNNGGGLVSEAYLLASKFAREKTHVGYVRYKTGKGHNDFSDYYARYVEPDETNPFHGKIVVITNRKVYSAANLFVSIMSSLPQVCIMGDNTGGGGGVAITAELYNGWTVNLSTNPMFDINKRSIESGIEPDYLVALDKNNQKDNIIEAAKAWILAK